MTDSSALPTPDRQAIVGRVFSSRTATCEPRAALAYALATNDENPRYRSGELAPPMYAVAFEFQGMFETLQVPEVILDPKRFLRLLHGEHDMRWHDVLRPGASYRTEASVSRVADKGSGELIELKLLTREADSQKLIVETTAGVFIRHPQPANAGEAKAEAKEPKAAAKSHGTPLFETSEHVALDQPLRYAEASGDHNPIHKDEATAKKAGLPGVILHGLCTMAFCEKALIDHLCGGDPARLARLKVRFAKPVLPGQTITIAAFAVEERPGLKTVALEARVGDAVVLKDGLAEIRA